MWTALVWSMLSETCSATLALSCHVECTMCSTLCLCVSVFLVARAICAMFLTLFWCVLRSIFGLVRLYPLVVTYLTPNLNWFCLIFIPFEIFQSSPRAKRAGPKGLRAESARAFTGRRCPHSGRGEDFLTGQLNFFTETAVTPERKVEKSFPMWEINRHAEG